MEEYVILIFILIIIALAYLFNSYFMLQKNYQPLQLEQQQYNTYIENENLPQKPEDTDNINYAEFIKECAPGNCAVNLNTGIKRCPQGNNVLVYDTRIEGCTNKDNCENPAQPYAVMEDGSVTTSNFCGKDIECRCSRNISCAYKDLSYFNLQTGGFTTASYNFINVIPGTSSGINPGQVSINIGENDFCKLNPAELNQIPNGCNLNNSIGDPINCGITDNSNYGQISLYESVNQNSIGNLVENDLSQFSNRKTLYPINNITEAPNVSDKGTYLLYISFENSIDFYKYLNIPNPIVLKLTSSTGTTIYTKVNFSYSNDIIYNENGNLVPGLQSWDSNWNIINSIDFINDYSGSKSKNYNESSVQISAENINSCGRAEEVNYKNTLMCLQAENDFCPLGTTSYNYDQEIYNTSMGDKENFSRRFCQEKSLGNNFLNSPAQNTVSCTLGSGCNGGNLTENEKSNKYFPDFDMNGLKNIFNFSLSQNNFNKEVNNSEDFSSYNPLDEYQILKNNLTKGDIWSILTYSNTLFYTGIKNSASTSFSVANLGSIVNFPFNSLPSSSYPKGTFGSCIGVSYLINGFNIMNLNGKITNFINFETPVGNFIDNVKTDSITLNLPRNAFSQLSGILRENPENSNNLQLCEYGSGSLIDENDSGVSITYNFIKQFGFNGFNYNTTIQGPCTTATNIHFYRENKYNMIPPFNTGSNKTNNFIFENKRLSTESIIENAPFNTEFSMYYPVWNPVLERQECVRCKPLLSSYLSFDREDLVYSQYQKIVDVTIQYSGRDFLNYEKNLLDNKFYFTTISKMSTDNIEQVNTSKKIYLDKPNPNINVGDYIIDSNLELNVNYYFYNNDPSSIIFNSNNTTDPGLSMLDLMGDYGINDSTHTPVSYEGTSLLDSNNLILNYSNSTLTKSNSTNPKNYFFGKFYTNKGTSSGIFLDPLVKVEQISGNVITTSENKSYLINKNSEETYLQFCRKDSKSLGVSLFANNNVLNEGDGIIFIDSISDGRITNLGLSVSSSVLQTPINNSPDIRISNYIGLQ